MEYLYNFNKYYSTFQRSVDTALELRWNPMDGRTPARQNTPQRMRWSCTCILGQGRRSRRNTAATRVTDSRQTRNVGQKRKDPQSYQISHMIVADECSGGGGGGGQSAAGEGRQTGHCDTNEEWVEGVQLEYEQSKIESNKKSRPRHTGRVPWCHRIEAVNYRKLQEGEDVRG